MLYKIPIMILRIFYDINFNDIKMKILLEIILTAYDGFILDADLTL